jgi:hypothetical protein
LEIFEQDLAVLRTEDGVSSADGEVGEDEVALTVSADDERELQNSARLARVRPGDDLERDVHGHFVRVRGLPSCAFG